MIYFYLISASPQTLNPVGVSVSPYRIVRVVDKEGHITGIRESSDTTLECTRQVKLFFFLKYHKLFSVLIKIYA